MPASVKAFARDHNFEVAWAYEKTSFLHHFNRKQLGVMVTGGLSGECSWALLFWEQGNSARIEAAEVPASPRAQELKQAAAWMPPCSLV